LRWSLLRQNNDRQKENMKHKIVKTLSLAAIMAALTVAAKTFAQSEPDNQYLACTARAISGHRANGTNPRSSFALASRHGRLGQC